MAKIRRKTKVQTLEDANAWIGSILDYLSYKRRPCFVRAYLRLRKRTPPLDRIFKQAK